MDQTNRDELTRDSQERIDGVVIGVVMNIDADGRPEVVFPGNLVPHAAPARATVPLDRSDIGAEVALMFEGGDPGKPIVMGRIQKPRMAEAQADVTVDGRPQPLTITGEREIVLRCGKASITLTKAGKIILRGTYISSRSTGVNRIKGGSVQLN